MTQSTPSFKVDEQIRYMKPQLGGKPEAHAHRSALGPVLHAAQILSANPAPLGKPLLGEAVSDADAPQVVAERNQIFISFFHLWLHL